MYRYVFGYLLFHDLYQNLNFLPDHITPAVNTQHQERTIPARGNSGDDMIQDVSVGLSWCKNQAGTGPLTGQAAIATHPFWTGCPPTGCVGCSRTDCFYADFIMNYWNFPRCD